MKNTSALGTVAVALCLSGCGGGGGGGGFPSNQVIQPAVSPPVVPTYTPVAGSDVFRTTEYNRMGALDAVHAADAYALGYTGAGVTIGVVDFNFDFSSAEVNFSPASVGLITCVILQIAWTDSKKEYSDQATDKVVKSTSKN